VQELRGAKVPFQLEVYSGTGHGFSTPKNKDEERANAQSIASTRRTLKELFGIWAQRSGPRGDPVRWVLAKPTLRRPHGRKG
jgi:dienelactone hydrolase